MAANLSTLLCGLSALALAPDGPVFDAGVPPGLAFHHENSPNPRKHLIETMGGGVALLDYNNDGLLDVFLVDGGRITESSKESFDRSNPLYWNRLFRQNKDGSFTDVTSAAGLASAGDANYGMGVAAADYDNDGFTDLYVTSYGRNILYHNNGNGTFTDVTAKASVAAGGWSASAGFFDFDNDGRPDIVVTDLARQNYAVYRNEGLGAFSHRSLQTGVAALSGISSGWGMRLEDFDNDGWKDLFVTQGHVMDNVEQVDPGLHSLEPPLLAMNREGRFERADSGWSAPVAGRGAAFGDLNNDGWTDIVMTVLGRKPIVFRNRRGSGHWLTLSLRGTPSNRDGFGARVRVNGQSQYATSAGSYLSASDKRVHFGLGMATSANVEIIWPSAVVQKIDNVQVDRFLTVVEPERP